MMEAFCKGWRFKMLLDMAHGLFLDASQAAATCVSFRGDLERLVDPDGNCTTADLLAEAECSLPMFARWKRAGEVHGVGRKKLALVGDPG